MAERLVGGGKKVKGSGYCRSAQTSVMTGMVELRLENTAYYSLYLECCNIGEFLLIFQILV